MPSKGHRSGSSAQLRSHSRSSSGSRIGANLQFTQKDGSATKAAEKTKKNIPEGARPGFSRMNSNQRVPSNAQIKRTTSNNAAQHKTNAAKGNTGFTITQNTEDDDDDDDDDDDEWVSSSGAQTPNQDDSDSDTASEGDSIPQELASQLQRAQLKQQTTRNPAPLARVDTARQSDFNSSPPPSVREPKQAPPTQMPFPTTHSDTAVQPDRYPQYNEQHQAKSSYPPDLGMPAKESNHIRSDSRQSSKRHSVTRPPSSLSVSSRPDAVRPHPLIRGQSHGHVNPVFRPTPLATLTVITDQPSNPTDENELSTSPASIRTNVTTPGGYTVDFPHERRTSFSSARSVSTLPVQSTTIPSRQYDRNRTLSVMSASPSSAALSSLAHLPNVTRTPSPQQISFFPPINPHVNTEAIHPLLPGPYLSNHLTVLARRTPLRESYDRVIRAQSTSGK